MLKAKVLFLFVIATLIIGCGSLQTSSSRTSYVVFSAIPPYDRERSNNEYGSITLAVPRYEPVITSHISIRGKKSGAALGAADGASSCLQMANDAGGAFLALICMPIAAIAGGVSGSANTESLDALESHESKVLDELSKLTPQITIKQQAMTYADQYGLKLNELDAKYGSDDPVRPFNYSGLPVDISDTFLELGIDRITLRGFGTRGIRYSIYFNGYSKLIRSDDNDVIDSLKLLWRSGRYTAEEWSENNYERLKQAVVSAGSMIARESIDEYFFLYYPKTKPKHKKEANKIHPLDTANNIETNNKKSDLVPYYSIKPLSPVIKAKTGLFAVFTGDWEFQEIQSSQPLLKWEAFPRKEDLEGIPLYQIGKVEYEIKLFISSTDEGHFSYPDREIYHRIGIKEPFHKIEKRLEPCHRYYWTVRASFNLNGNQKFTEWSGRYPDSDMPYPFMQRRSLSKSGYRSSNYYYGFKIIGDGSSCP
ncbi:MAG: hypothetical protein ABW086_12860 [Sedimenticola sp.]